jgi:hypothetical protein
LIENKWKETLMSEIEKIFMVLPFFRVNPHNFGINKSATQKILGF